MNDSKMYFYVVSIYFRCLCWCWDAARCTTTFQMNEWEAEGKDYKYIMQLFQSLFSSMLVITAWSAGGSSRPVSLQFKGVWRLEKMSREQNVQFFRVYLTPPTSVPMHECMCNSCFTVCCCCCWAPWNKAAGTIDLICRQKTAVRMNKYLFSSTGWDLFI